LRIRLEIGLISDVAVWEGAEVLFQHLYRLLQRKVAGPIRENEFVQLAFIGHAQIPFQVAGQVLQYIGMPFPTGRGAQRLQQLVDITDGEVTNIVRALGDRTPERLVLLAIAGHQQIFVATVEALQAGLAQALLPHLSPARVAIDTGEETVQCLRVVLFRSCLDRHPVEGGIQRLCVRQHNHSVNSIRRRALNQGAAANVLSRRRAQYHENPGSGMRTRAGEIETGHRETRGFRFGLGARWYSKPGECSGSSCLGCASISGRFGWAGSAVGVLSGARADRAVVTDRELSSMTRRRSFCNSPSSCIWAECHCASRNPAFSIAWAVASAPVTVIVTVIAAAIASFIRCLSLNMHRRAELFSYGSHRRPLQGVQPLK